MFLGILQKMASSRTNYGNAQILELLLNVQSSSAKIRVPDPLLVLTMIKTFSLHHFESYEYLVKTYEDLLSTHTHNQTTFL